MRVPPCIPVPGGWLERGPAEDTAVDDELRTGDEGRRIGGEVEARIRDVLRAAEPPERRGLEPPLHPIRPLGLERRRPDQAGHDEVYANAVRPEIMCGRACQVRE